MIQRKGLIVLLFFTLASTHGSFCQVIINEVSSNNFSSYPDNDGDFVDWIELYNPTASPINLLNYKLSDDPLLPAKWTFPNVNIAAGSYLTVFASDKNKVDMIDHWEMIVTESDTWKYSVPDATTPLNWKDASFDDATWISAAGGFGYGTIGETTAVPAGTVSIFMRRTFNVVDSTAIKDMILNVDYDDGFVAYLNGVEIARNNMGVSPPSYNTLAATSFFTAGTPAAFAVSPSVYKPLLKNGNNVLSIQVHNSGAGSSDLLMRAFLMVGIGNTSVNYYATPAWFIPPAGSAIYLHTNFAINNAGETIQLSDASNALVDQITVPAMETNDTYGRYLNGSATWSLLNPATANASNSTSTPYTGYWTDTAGIALPAGFYTGTQTTILTSTDPLSEIRYTLDGSKPTATSTLYTGGNISIASTQVIRAACFRPGYLSKIISTNSYFISDPSTIRTISISTHPGNFFNADTGLYVMGPGASGAFPYFGANFWMDWEREVHVEYFDKSGAQGFEQDAGVQISGGYSRGHNMKSLRLKAKSKYGPKKFEYPLFTEKSVGKFNVLVLRNKGNDFNYAHMRDAINHRVHDKKTFVDISAYEPCQVYINGAYWGVYELREHIDAEYIDQNHGYDEEEIDLLEFEGTPKVGNNTHFLNMSNFILNNDMTLTANYTTVKTMLDIQNYADYFIAETYHTNWDWPHNNVLFWRPNVTGGKWRYILWDTDFAFQLFNNCGGFGNCPTSNELDRVINDTRTVHSAMLKKMLTNDEFRCYFVSRYADLMNTIFQPANYKSVVDNIKTEMSPEMTKHFTRWPDNGGSVGNWDMEVSGIKSWMDNRLSNGRTHVAALCGATQVTVTYDASPAGSGVIQISTVIPESLPFTGVYFNCCPITITAIPNPGYTFDHWLSTTSIPAPNTNTSVTLTPGASETFTAYFSSTPNFPKVTISEINYNPNLTCDAGDWIEFHNSGTAIADLSNWTFKDANDFNVFTFPAGTTIPVGGYLVLINDVTKFNATHPTVTNYVGPMTFNLSNGGEYLRLYDNTGKLYLDMTYDDASPWPLIADGGGSTLEQKDVNGSLNDPLNWFDGCKCGSPGTAFVPCPCQDFDLGPDQYLCANGGSVILNTGLTAHPNRTFKWYYNGMLFPGTSPTLSTSVAGLYSVLVDSMGCFKTDVIRVSSDLTFSLGPDIGLCDPATAILNSGLSPSGVTFEWAKNTIIIPEETDSSLLVKTPGIYTLTARAVGCADKTDEVNVTSVAAIPVDGDRCGPGTVNLSVIGSGIYNWYADSLGGAPLSGGSGTSSFTTPFISSTTTYYVEDASYFAGSVGPLNPTVVAAGTGDIWTENNTDYKLRFNVLQPLFLDSVTLFADVAQTITVRVLQPDKTTVRFSKVVNLIPGQNRVHLGFQFLSADVKDGYYMDYSSPSPTTAQLLMNGDGSSPSYPYTAAGYMQITESNASWGSTNSAGWYHYFYNLKFSSGPGPCARVPVSAIINCSLPVDLLSFTGKFQDEEVLLNWITTGEVNNAYYDIQRSVNGEHFESIGKVPGAGTYTGLKSYLFTDGNPANGKNYYRLVQYDMDGTANTSDVILVKKAGSALVNIFPNPYDHQLNILVTEEEEVPVTFVISDLSGKPVYHSSEYKTNELIILEDGLPAGMYFMYIAWSDQVKIEKIIKRE